MNEHAAAAPPLTEQPGFRIPTSKVRWTYVLMACNIVVFLMMTAFGLLAV